MVSGFWHSWWEEVRPIAGPDWGGGGGLGGRMVCSVLDPLSLRAVECGPEARSGSHQHGRL